MQRWKVSSKYSKGPHQLAESLSLMLSYQPPLIDRNSTSKLHTLDLQTEVESQRQAINKPTSKINQVNSSEDMQQRRQHQLTTTSNARLALETARIKWRSNNHYQASRGTTRAAYIHSVQAITTATINGVVATIKTATVLHRVLVDSLVLTHNNNSNINNIHLIKFYNTSRLFSAANKVTSQPPQRVFKHLQSQLQPQWLRSNQPHNRIQLALARS